MNETLPHFLNLDGLVINVDKILYIRESELIGNAKGSFIGFDVMEGKELYVDKMTPNQMFELLIDYEKHLRELKTQGLA